VELEDMRATFVGLRKTLRGCLTVTASSDTSDMSFDELSVPDPLCTRSACQHETLHVLQA
jgi:hypothetical protein